MYKTVKTITESINYDLYIVSSKDEANKIEADNAIILYEALDNNNKIGYFARTVVKENSNLKITEKIDRSVSISSKIFKRAQTLKKYENQATHEINLNKENIEEFDAIIKTISTNAGLPLPKQGLLSILNGVTQLSDQLPHLLEAFTKIPLLPILKKLKKSVEENYKKIEELKNQFAPAEQEQEQEQKSQKTIDITATTLVFLAKMKDELKVILDEKVFNDYFLHNTPSTPTSPWIHQVANIFHDIKNITDRIDQLQKRFPELLSSENPLDEIEERMDAADELIAAGIELASKLNQLHRHKELRKIIFLNKIEVESKVSSLVKQISTSHTEFKNAIDPIKAANNPLIKALEIISTGIMNKDTSRSFNRETTIALSKITPLVSELQNIFKNTEDDTVSPSNIVLFVIKNFNEILKIKNELPNIFILLKTLSNAEAMKVLEGIHSSLIQLALFADKIEIQLSLKQGYLNSRLTPLIDTFYEMMNKQGYDFPHQDQYTQALDRQRRQFLEDPTLPELQRNLITHRQNSRLKKIHTPAIQNKIDDMLSNQIELLTNRKGQSLKQSNALDKKIAIYTNLLALSDLTSGNLDAMLKQFRQQYPNDINLLYSGDDNNILKKFELSGTDISKVLATELTHLNKQRGSTYFLRSIDQAKLLEDRINAYENLQYFIQHYNLKDAINHLTPDHQLLLQKYDSLFLDNLKLIEKNLPIQHKPKTVLGLAQAKERQDQRSTISDDMQDLQRNAVNLLDNRLKELDQSLFKTHTKKIKVDLLNELKKQLNLGYTLDSAIKHMKTDDKYKNDIHLLFEGNTGKILKMAQNITMTKEDLLLRLDAEINSLKKERYTHLHVFANTRKHYNEQHIEALLELRNKINNSTHSLKEILNELTPEHKKLLHHYEPDLIMALDKAVSSPTPQQK